MVASDDIRGKREGSGPRRREILGLSFSAAALLLLFVATLAGLVGYFVAKSQSDARDRLVDEFLKSSQATAQFTSAALSTATQSGSAQAQQNLCDQSPRLAALLKATGPPSVWGAVLDGDGHVLTAYPSGGPGFATIGRAVAAAEHGSPWTGDVVGSGAMRGLQVATPFYCHGERRVLEFPVPVHQLSSVARLYLGQSFTHSDGELIDSNEVVVGSDGDEVVGAPLRDRNLGAALTTGTTGSFDASGTERTYAVAPVAHSSLRLVATIPSSVLFEPVSHGNAVQWVLFAVAVLATLVALYSLLRHLRRRRIRAVAEQRRRDPVTGLETRSAFVQRAGEAISLIPRDPHAAGVAVVAVNIRRFRRFNDALGQDAGDDILAEIARRLASIGSNYLAVGRLGGDELAVLAQRVSKGAIDELTETITEAVCAPLEIEGSEIPIDLRYGIYVATSPDERPDLAVDSAETALHDAAASDEQGQVFRHEQRDIARRRLGLEGDLRRAIREEEFLLEYQPIVSLQSGLVVAVEALVRWEHPTLGLLQPGSFVGILEESGLIVELGEWVMRTSLGQLRDWQRDGIALNLNVNISARQLSDPHLPDLVSGLLAESSIEPECVTLEVTETATLSHPDRAFARLRELRGSGLRLAIDDFGAGYSSLGHLAQSVVLDMLKIDRSFVAQIEKRRPAAIVGNAVDLCERIGIASVAEGVETAEQAATVTALKCELAQGFHFHRPQSPERLAGVIAGAV